MFTSQDSVIRKSYQICQGYFIHRKQEYDPTRLESVERHREKASRFFAQNLLLDGSLAYEVVQRGVSDAAQYVVHAGVFQLKNGVSIPFHLYIPHGDNGPKPALLFPIGHYPAGKTTPEYVIMAQTLAAAGCICLIYDPIGQGERDAQPDGELIRELKDLYTVYRHMQAGDQLYEAGQQLAAWFVAESRMAVDYLLSRADVDPARVGVVGQSGGGTNVQYLCAVEPRLSLAIPIHCTTTYELLLERTVGDCEQTFFGCIANGIEMSDFYIPWAGKALCIIGGKEDFFHPDGARQVYEEIYTTWKTLHADTSRLCFVLCDGGHVISHEVRKSVYKFVQQVFGTPDVEELSIPLEKPMCLSPEERQKTQEAFLEEMKRRVEGGRKTLDELYIWLSKDKEMRFQSCCDHMTEDSEQISVTGTKATETMQLIWGKKSGKTLWLMADTEMEPPQDAAVAEIFSDGMDAYRGHRLGYSMDAVHYYLSVLTGCPLWLQRTAQLEKLLEPLCRTYEKIVVCSDGFLYYPTRLVKPEVKEHLVIENVKKNGCQPPSDLLCKQPEGKWAYDV